MSQAKLNSLRATSSAMQERKTRKRLLQEVQDQKDREAAGRAYDKVTGMKNGGMVKATAKATPYMCGGKVK
jgi:hypothetical protein